MKWRSRGFSVRVGEMRPEYAWFARPENKRRDEVLAEKIWNEESEEKILARCIKVMECEMGLKLLVTR